MTSEEAPDTSDLVSVGTSAADFSLFSSRLPNSGNFNLDSALGARGTAIGVSLRCSRDERWTRPVNGIPSAMRVTLGPELLQVRRSSPTVRPLEAAPPAGVTARSVPPYRCHVACPTSRSSDAAAATSHTSPARSANHCDWPRAWRDPDNAGRAYVSGRCRLAPAWK